LLGYKFDAGHAARDSKARLATHALDGLSFIPRGGTECKCVYEVWVNLLL
jgi:hypothetical protein